jgi:RNA polymerase sigma-70 factor (ECF subfamily)
LDALMSGAEDEAPFQPESPAPGPYELVASRQQVERLGLFLSGLPAHYREALVLRYHEELGIEEIAAITRAPASTVKTRIARGLKALGSRLETYP